MKHRKAAMLLAVGFVMATVGADDCSTEEDQPSSKPKLCEPDPKNPSPALPEDDIPCSRVKGDKIESGEGDVSEPPDPNGTFNINCDYLLGDFSEGTDSGFKFVAGGTLKNTGNIGIVVRVRVRWDQLGTGPILEERRVRLPVGRTKRVSITRLASQNEIDAHQSAEGNCSPAAKIIDVFGEAR